ncbi:unnamed protein product [Effrenium voratum]|nr:unnamed protein product [Effrenium voratum]
MGYVIVFGTPTGLVLAALMAIQPHDGFGAWSPWLFWFSFIHVVVPVLGFLSFVELFSLYFRNGWISAEIVLPVSVIYGIVIILITVLFGFQAPLFGALMGFVWFAVSVEESRNPGAPLCPSLCPSLCILLAGVIMVACTIWSPQGQCTFCAPEFWEIGGVCGSVLRWDWIATPQEDISVCAPCMHFDLANNTSTCSCHRGTAQVFCPGPGIESCMSCDTGFHLVHDQCVPAQCAEELQGLRPSMPPNPPRPPPPPPCAQQHAFNGTCAVSTQCAPFLPNSLQGIAVAKGNPPFELGVPEMPILILCGTIIAVPIVYSMATRTYFMLAVEIAVSAGDFASDLLNSFENDYFNMYMCVASFAITFGAGVITIFVHYGGGLVFTLVTTFNKVAWITYDRLRDHGVHQVFEVHHSADKFLVNIFATALMGLATPLLFFIAGPTIAGLQICSVFCLGAILHSLRLLLVREVQEAYGGLLGVSTEKTSTKKEEPVNPASYHQIIVLELLTEAVRRVLLCSPLTLDARRLCRALR